MLPSNRRIPAKNDFLLNCHFTDNGLHLLPFAVRAVRTPRKDYFAVSTSSQTQIERGLAGSSQLCQSRLGTG